MMRVLEEGIVIVVSAEGSKDWIWIVILEEESEKVDGEARLLRTIWARIEVIWEVRARAEPVSLFAI